jgi:hypothetical protein
MEVRSSDVIDFVGTAPEIFLDRAPMSEVASRRMSGNAANLVAPRSAVVLIRRSTLILPVNVPRFVEKAGLRNGTASVSVDGAMVDTPVYRRPKRTLEQAAAVAEVENRKAAALARLA